MEEANIDQPSSTPTQDAGPRWSNIVKQQPVPKAQPQNSSAPSSVFVESCKSTKGIAVAVVDANAIIEGGERLTHIADKFVSVPEVIGEIRDPLSRHRLAVVPFTVDTMEPSPESLSKVVKFARATGDLQTLSDVDMKLIALTYTLEAQVHGISHLRDCPPPVNTITTRRLPEKEMPGWGNNVPNLDEWEALEQEAEDGSNPSSRILPLKDLNLNTVPQDNYSEDGSKQNNDESHYENPEDAEDEGSFRKPKKWLHNKKEINIEGKKMVANGVDASQGQDDGAGDWMPAVGRSTHRRFLRRKARREHNEALLEKDAQQDIETKVVNHMHVGTVVTDKLETHDENGISEDREITAEEDDGETLFSALQQIKLEENDFDEVREGLDNLEISSQTNGTVDDDSSEQSWMIRSLSESSIACVTGDFAMQNVLLQMGLRLLAPGGMQIRQLHRWILKCHACYAVTAEIGRIFCPKCGNGGTLRKVAVTVGENGIVLADRRPRVTLRGTKFSLPLPQGGRDAITKNLILREDQLPQKLLYPKTKKKVYKEGDDLFLPSNHIFTHHTDKRAPLQPPVRKALAVFSGKRNPNDNHFSRSKNK